MSLDVCLTIENHNKTGDSSGIFVRENGQVRELTRAEWNERCPNYEPVIMKRDSGEVYWANITHNLNEMARAANLYQYLWRPDVIGITTANQLIEPLSTGLELLLSDRARFEAFNPENGWGDYDGLVSFVRKYLTACIDYPMATVSVSR
jgi:hypothetical protein